MFFVALLVACAGALLLLAPMVNLRSFVQREEDEAEAADESVAKPA